MANTACTAVGVCDARLNGTQWMLRCCVMTRPPIQSFGQYPEGVAAQYWRKRTAHLGDSGQPIHEVPRIEDARACHRGMRLNAHATYAGLDPHSAPHGVKQCIYTTYTHMYQCRGQRCSCSCGYTAAGLHYICPECVAALLLVGCMQSGTDACAG